MKTILKKAQKATNTKSPTKATKSQAANGDGGEPVLSEYNGNPMLCLNPESFYKFQFGLGKARLIVQHIDAIKAFVESEGASIE